jgi:DNA-binding NarL/FixJ family response regulator
MSEQAQGRVLIVDDQREVARALRTMLTVEHPDWHVADVPSGEEALLDLAAERYDVVVVDFRLPGISGRELLLRVREVAPAVRIVFMSGYEMDRIRRDLGDLDVAAVLQKPLDMDEFLSVVGEAVQAAARDRAAGRERKDDPASAADRAEQQRAQLEAMIAGLRADLDALAAALIDLAGEPAMTDGALADVPNFARLARALAGHFASLNEVGQSIGPPVEAIHTYRGSRYDVYALSAGAEFFVALVFPGGGPNRLRPVLRHGRPVVDALTRVLGEMLGQEMPEPDIESEPEELETGTLPFFETEPAPEPPMEAPAQELPHLPPLSLDAEPESDAAEAMSLADGNAAPLDIDLEGLELDLEAADTDALNAFWQEAGSGAPGIDLDALSHEEAVRRGLIPEDVDFDDED